MWNNIRPYCNKRLLVVTLLGFSSGLPLALVMGSLQAWFKTSGVDIVTIGFLGLITQPYSYKFLWAPLMDRFEPLSLGRRRGWMLLTQLTIFALIAVLTRFDPITHPKMIGLLGLLLSFCSASQDIVIDAYRTDVLHAKERGLGIAFGVEAYRVAMIVSGGGALIVADRLGWQNAYLIMGSLMLVGIFATAIAPNVATTIVKREGILQLIKNSMQNFLQREKAVLLLLLIIFYKLGDAFSHALSTVFLLDLNFSLTAVGTINKGVGVVAGLIGVFFGGILLTRVDLFKALLGFAILQSITNLTYMLLALAGKNYALAIAAFFIENLCSGMGNAALVVLITSLCNVKYSATQYALFSSLAVLGRVYVGPCSGLMVKYFGWANFYLATAIIALPGIYLVLHLKKHIQGSSQERDVVNAAVARG